MTAASKFALTPARELLSRQTMSLGGMLSLDTIVLCASRRPTSDPPSYDDGELQHSELAPLLRQAEPYCLCHNSEHSPCTAVLIGL